MSNPSLPAVSQFRPCLVQMSLWLLCGLFATSSSAVDRRAVSSGMWQDPAIWAPAGVPQLGDRVLGLGDNDVRVTGEAVVGDGTESVVLEIDGAGQLTVGSDATLTLHGHLEQSARAASVLLEANAQLLFNPDSDQIYQFRQMNSAQRLVFAGLPESRARVGLADNAAGHYFFRNIGFRDSTFSGSYGIIEDAFDPISENAWGIFLNNEPGVSSVKADHIEFLRCGQLRILGLGAGEHTEIDLDAITFRDQAKSGDQFIAPAFAFDGYLDASIDVAQPLATKRITNLVSESRINLRFVQGFTLDNFVLGPAGSGNARVASDAGNALTHNNVFVYSTSGGSSTNLIADVTDTSYFYIEGDNPHGWATPQLRSDALLSNFWFESNFPGQSDPGDAVLTDGPQRAAAEEGGEPIVLTLEHSGSIGDFSADPSHPVLFTFNNSEGIRLIARHNITRVNFANQGISIDENGTTFTGTGITLTDTIFFADVPDGGSAIGHAPLDPVAAPDPFLEVDFNLYHNLSTNGTDGSLGVHRAIFTAPIDANSLIADPMLVDSQRNLASWDASLGGPGTVENAIAELFKRNDDVGFNPEYDVAGLTAYVAAGYSTTNPSAIGSDGTVIGPGLFLSDRAPEIRAQPQNTQATVGATASLVVAAFGQPAPVYQWRQDGIELEGATQPVLELVDVSLQDAGEYDVVITNSEGSVTSELVLLTIQEAPSPPIITTQPQDQTVTAGTGVFFQVAAVGVPAPSYQWQRDALNLEGETDSILSVNEVTNAQNGEQYQVVVSNPAGSVTSDVATLTVEPVPGVLSNPDTSLFSATIDLTQAGSVDWVHWIGGPNAPVNLNRKAGVVARIGDFTSIGDAVPAGAGTTATYTWSNGTPTLSETTSTARRLFELGSGYRWEVAADATPRTLTLYLGGRNMVGTLRASLSDDSAEPLEIVLSSPTARDTHRVTLDYQASTDGQSLVLEYVMTERLSGGATSSHISIEAATLVGGDDPGPTDNAAPVINNPGDLTMQVGEPVSLQIEATDTDLDPLSFSAQGLPTGLSIDEATGLISGVLSVVDDFTVSVTVADGNGGSAVAVFGWVVLPDSTSVGLLSLTESTPITGSVDLTALAELDWVRWSGGPNASVNLTRRAGVAPLISDFTTLSSTGDVIPSGAGTSATYTWSDGSPSVSGTSNSGRRLFDLDSGFRWEVAADTQPRTVTLYLGARSASGTLRVSLSDGSAVAFEQVLSSPGARETHRVTVDYQAASAGQTLILEYVMSERFSNGPTTSHISIEAATR